MQRFVLALAISSYASFTLAQEPDKDKALPPVIPQVTINDALSDPLKRDALLQELYRRLKTTSSEADADRVQATIMALLDKTGNAASDLFLEWGEESYKAGDAAQALDYFDGAALLTPNAPEPYHRRAVVYYAHNDYTHALADLQRAYALEPRHTGVLLGLGSVLTDLDRDKEALAAFRKALELNPKLEDAKKLEKQLARKVEGDGV